MNSAGGALPSKGNLCRAPRAILGVISRHAQTQTEDLQIAADEDTELTWLEKKLGKLLRWSDEIQVTKYVQYVNQHTPTGPTTSIKIAGTRSVSQHLQQCKIHRCPQVFVAFRTDPPAPSLVRERRFAFPSPLFSSSVACSTAIDAAFSAPESCTATGHFCDTYAHASWPSRCCG